MKLGIIGDVHLDCADFTERRRADFVAAFANAVTTCLAHGAEVLCLLGDVFDSAIMRRNVEAFAATIREVGPIFRRLEADKVAVYAIAGNHEFGRGREAGELSVLESLGFLRVLRGDTVDLGVCTVSGLAWHSQDELVTLHERIRALGELPSSGQRLLLLHNFVKGSASLPSHLGEVDPSVATGFERVFVGHHHDAEEVGRFAMPGATEVQNLAEGNRQKSVIVYDTKSRRVTFHLLPRTRQIVIVNRDLAEFEDRAHLFATLAELLESRDVTQAFVCVRLHGEARPACQVTKAEVVRFLRERDVFDRFVDVRATRPTMNASDAIRSMSIDGLVRKAFGTSAKKATRYLDQCVRDDFAASIIDEILQ